MKTTSQMLTGSESERDVFRPNCQKTWTRTMEKGGFVLRMVFLMMYIGFWVLTRNFELNNDNLNCLNPHVQETVGCWSRVKAATISVINRERVSAKLSKLIILMANSSYASMMQGRKRAGGKKQLECCQTISRVAETSSATVRRQYVTARICNLIDKIRKRKGNLISSLTCPVLLNRKAQSAEKKARVSSHGKIFTGNPTR